jgi:hypothetical protein
MPSEENDITKRGKTHFTVVENMPDYDGDPVFLKKDEEALKALQEAPLPDFIAKRIEKPE